MVPGLNDIGGSFISRRQSFEAEFQEGAPALAIALEDTQISRASAV